MFWKKKEEEEFSVDDEAYRTDENYPSKVCPLCSRSYDDDSIFCKYDGQRLSIVEAKGPRIKGMIEIRCPYCGNTVVPRSNGICPICGNMTVKSVTGRGRSLLLLIDGVYPVRIERFPYEFGRRDVVRLPGAENVNSKHLEFSIVDGKIMVKDTRSLNGTKLNETVIGNHGKSFGDFELKTGDSLELCLDDSDRGKVRMRVKVNV